MIEKGNVVLFQGDSITDADRLKKPEVQDKANELWQLGRGYAKMAASTYLATRPADQLQFFNRGISGHRVVDLYARWKKDCLNLKPDVLSILIGINDTWHHFNYDNGVEPERYEQVYRMMLDWTMERLPNLKLVLCEPFYLKCGVVTDEWVPDVKARQAIVRQLAVDYNAKLVPFQTMFDEACEEAAPEYWAEDGVHPSPAGHHRMAQCWMNVVGGLS